MTSSPKQIAIFVSVGCMDCAVPQSISSKPRFVFILWAQATVLFGPDFHLVSKQTHKLYPMDCGISVDDVHRDYKFAELAHKTVAKKAPVVLGLNQAIIHVSTRSHDSSDCTFARDILHSYSHLEYISISINEFRVTLLSDTASDVTIISEDTRGRLIHITDTTN